MIPKIGTMMRQSPVRPLPDNGAASKNNAADV
jgi:hypothetical protein